MEEHFRKLERMYHAAPINAFYNPRLKVEKGRAELTMEVKPEFHHAAQAVHGSVYFKALDDAAYFAVNSLVEDAFVLTASFNLYFLLPISSGTLTAKGQILHESKNNYIAESILFDQDGNQISRGTGSFIRSKIPLPTIKDYAFDRGG